VQGKRAIEGYNEAIRLKPDYADTCISSGVVYLWQGKKNLGCRDAQKACTLGNCKLLEDEKSKGRCR